MRVWSLVVLAACASPAASPRTIAEIPSPIFLADGDAPPQITLDEARALFPAGISTPTAPAAPACTTIECLIERAYTEDPRARALALALFRGAGHVAGVGPEEIMDGGYRGKIRLVPQLPIGKYRKHLQWLVEADRSIDRFFSRLFEDRPAPAYRWRALQLRFVRSVGKHTPSAYAMGWLIAYNVEGSLLTSAAGVRETYFHELFHNNDAAHGDWSARHLARDYEAIVARCGTSRRCLAPYAPNDTTVRGGTYYAFQPDNGNGVHEYAAELAVRYWKEHRELLETGKLARRPFKCGRPENGRSWRALVGEFFGGRDLTPTCP
ncbi:MAG: hypothetical protein ACTHU0_06075 [Kofleriaceae bacterium]